MNYCRIVIREIDMTGSVSIINSLVMRMVFLFMATVSGPTGTGVVLTAPVQNDTVTVSNEKTQTWWDNYKKGSGVRMAQKKEFCKPDPVILKWDMAETSTSAGSDTPYKYLVYVSTDPDLNRIDTMRVFYTEDTSYKLYNLFSGTTYYWKVIALGNQGILSSGISGFHTKEGPRTLYVKGSYNTRDIGGYMTSSGRRVRQGLVYRSGNFDSIKDTGKKTIKELGIKTQLDLRKDDEGKAGIKTLPVENYHHIRGHSYKRIWKSSRRVKRTIKIMKLFAHEENYPIAFHCIYGRDRAGTIAFLLSGMLGVSKYDLYRDYEVTFLSKNSGSHGRHKMKLLDGFYKKLKNYKDSSQSLQYNIQAFLIDNGMTEEEIHNIEKIMLEEEPAG